MSLLCCNLFSITTALGNGMKLSNKQKILILRKNKLEIKFYAITTTTTGYIGGFRFFPNDNLASDCALNDQHPHTIDVMQYRRILGHPYEVHTRQTSQLNHINLTGEWVNCESCALDKAKQKNLSQINHHKTKVVGERLYTYISYIQGTSLGGKNYWVIIVDEATSMKFCGFIKFRHEFPAFLVEFI